MIRAVALLTLLALSPTLAAAAARLGLDADIGAQGVTVLDNGQPVFFYRTKSANPGAQPARLDYIHPLFAPDGAVLTEDAPADHPDQRGLFWSWDRVLVDGKLVASGEAMTGLTWFVKRTRFEGQADGSAFLIVDADWIDRSGPELRYLADETTRIHIWPLAAGQTRRLDFATTITPKVAGLAVAGSADAGGHGGFIIRLIRPQSLVFASDGTVVQPAQGAISAGTSMGFSWASGPAWSVGLSCRANGAPITRWVLRRAPSAQNCVFPGAQAYAIQPGAPLDLEASVVIRPRRR
ncbi:MAG: DUF6807 family protein [Caulobacteraceae bacterium]